MQSKILANDFTDSKIPEEIYGYGFENIKEVSAGLRFNFFEFNLHEFGQLMLHHLFFFVNLFYAYIDNLFFG
jgi:hypothetical protein